MQRPCIAQNPQTLNPERQGFRCGALTTLDLPRSSVLGLYYIDNRNTNITNTGYKNRPLKASTKGTTSESSGEPTIQKISPRQLAEASILKLEETGRIIRTRLIRCTKLCGTMLHANLGYIPKVPIKPIIVVSILLCIIPI